jgi:hypothetical protein
MPPKAKAKIDIEVMPYLSIMVCTLLIICLILIVTVMRVAMNPQAQAVVSFKSLFSSKSTGTYRAKTETAEELKAKELAKSKVFRSPTYIECMPDKITMFPGQGLINVGELQQPGNPLEAVLTRMATNTAKEYVIMLVRPYSVSTYRTVRKLVKDHNVDYGYDVLAEGATIDWKAEAKALNINLAE